MATADDIDALLAGEKALLGTTQWRPDLSRPERTRLVATISSSPGVVIGQLELHAHATLHTTPQHGGVVLLAEARAVQRMNIFPQHSHVNPLASRVAPIHRGGLMPQGSSTFYPWSLDRRWPRSPALKLDTAILAPDSFLTFGEALTWFLVQCRIRGHLQPPPHEPQLFL